MWDEKDKMWCEMWNEMKCEMTWDGYELRWDEMRDEKKSMWDVMKDEMIWNAMKWHVKKEQQNGIKC